MSYFVCPGSSTPHYIFGKPATFDATCAELGLDVLGEIPIEPDVSSTGDTGAPIVVSSPDGVSKFDIRENDGSVAGYSRVAENGPTSAQDGGRGAPAVADRAGLFALSDSTARPLGSVHHASAKKAFIELGSKVWDRLVAEQ